MAQAEDRIEKMQKKITEQENQLATLEAAQGINRRQYDELSSNRTKTEQDLAQLMRFLWPVFVGPVRGSGLDQRVVLRLIGLHGIREGCL